jgi:hypothetical protein
LSRNTQHLYIEAFVYFICKQYKMASASLALDAVKSGHIDLWYSDPMNSLKQAIPVDYDTRFVQAFQSTLTGGQQVLTLPPGAAIRDVVLAFGYNSATMAAVNATSGVSYALPKGWGYNAIDRVSWRVAGSSEYYLTGSQLLLRNLRLTRTQQQAEALLNLGGNEVSQTPAYAVGQNAYIPLSFWKSPCLDSFEPALAADLLGSQIQIRVYFKTPAQFWASLSGAVGAPPTNFSFGFFQVQQLNMLNRAQSLAAMEDMATHTYVAPLRAFDQQVLTAPISANWTPGSQVTITGIMSGQVKALQIWLVNNVFVGGANQNLTVAPYEVRAAYAGVIYASYDQGTSQMWNLLDSSKPPIYNTNSLVPNGGSTAWVSTSTLGSYVMLPFSQPIQSDEEATLLVAGKPIANGAVTIFLTVPDNTQAYTLYVVPILNGAIAYSRGSAQILVG